MTPASRFCAAALVALAVPQLAVPAVSSAGPPRSAVQQPGGVSLPAAPRAGNSGVEPWHPQGLAVAPDGDLYIVDTGRDEVLRLLASGVFQVVAGDGRRGFSGDGGQATRAELDLDGYSGLAFGKSGTLYIADSLNHI